MLALTTMPNPISLFNLADHLLRLTPPRIQEAADLVKLVLSTSNKSSIGGNGIGNIPPFIKLKTAHTLLSQNLNEEAKLLVEDLDAKTYLNSEITIAQINLFFSILIRTGKAQKALRLINAVPIGGLCDEKTITDVKLKIAQALFCQNLDQEAKELVADLDTEHFFNSVTNAGQADRVFDVLIRSGEAPKALKLITAKRIDKLLDKDTETDFKLKIARSLIMQGYKGYAKNLLSDISPETLTNPVHGALLAHAFTQIGLFDHADHIFTIAERKGLISDEFYIFKAVLHYCLRQMGSADRCINKSIDQHGKNPPSFFWKSHLLNFNGRHQEANTWLDYLLNSSSLAVSVHVVFVYVGKGNALRSLGRFDESLQFYRKAEKIQLGDNAIFWAWIAYFEHAITLFYLGKNAQALQIALQGSRLDSRTYNNSYNPCTILFQFLFQRQKRIKEPPPALTEWARYAKRWPFPYFHHKMWMLLLTAIVLSDQKRPKDSKAIITDMVNDQTIVALNHRDGINGVLANSESWRNQGFLNTLSIVIWPHHAEKSFERMMVRRLICTE